MANVADRLERLIRREAPTWGVRPVPSGLRRLGGLDLAVLWGDLSVGLLVAVTGALLVPALGLPAAAAAIVVGSAAGCLLLALVGAAGAEEGVPGMVLFRPVLGVRGSYVPTVLNAIQLVGWTAFELWAMALVADRTSRDLFGVGGFVPWLVVVTLLCTALALGGPILVVRRWMERFGVWLVVAVGAWITVSLLRGGDLGAAWSRPGEGGLPFWLAVDLVVVMPISWLPLVADYNRFARSGRSGLAGTFAGYFLGNVWFYLLGAMLVLVGGLADPSPAGLATSIAAVAGGGVVLVALLVGETDQAFADVYSTALSMQNLAPRLPQRATIVAVAALGAAVAWLLGTDPAGALGSYEHFLFLLGSVFVPLYGVFLADRFALRRRGYAEADLFERGSEGPYWYRAGFRPAAVGAWLLGFLVYHWSGALAPSWWMAGVEWLLHDALGLPYPLLGGAAGASLPAFAAAFALHAAIGRAGGRLSPARRPRSGPASRAASRAR